MGLAGIYDTASFAPMMGDWFGNEAAPRVAAIDAYASIRPMNPEERAAIAAFERSGALLAGARWLRWRFVDGVDFDDPGIVVRGLIRGVARLASV